MAGKAKNDGTLVQVRLSSRGHGDLAVVMAALVQMGEVRPGAVTKALAIERALGRYRENLEMEMLSMEEGG